MVLGVSAQRMGGFYGSPGLGFQMHIPYFKGIRPRGTFTYTNGVNATHLYSSLYFLSSKLLVHLHILA